MGNGVSTDVRRTLDRKQHDWSDRKLLQWRFQRGAEFFRRQHLSKQEIVGNEGRWIIAVMKDDRSSSEQPSSEEERRSSRRREKTGSVMQAEMDTGQTVYMQVEPDTGQTAYTSRRQKTGSAMQIESRDPRSYPIQTAYTPTESSVQVEPTDIQVHPGQTAHLPTGSGMQVESLDSRSCPIQTSCTTPSMVARQEDSARPTGPAVAPRQEEDNGRQERRQRSPPDTAACMTVDASARPISGRATVQPDSNASLHRGFHTVYVV